MFKSKNSKMKKNLLLGMFLLAGVGVSTAQVGLFQKKEINLDNKAPNSSASPKALGDVVWHDNFDSIVSGAGLATVSASSWTANNSGQTGATFGWTVDNVYDGWWITGTGTNVFNSTSGGKFAEVSNGNPNPPSSTQKLGVNYTLTSGAIDVQTLAGSGNVLLSFEQRGAKFYDSTYVQVSTNGTTWTTVYTNMHKPIHSATSSNIWPNPETIEVDISSALQAGASTVQIRFGWTSEFPSETNPNAWVAYGWFIDDVKIITKPDYDLVFTYDSYHTQAYQYSRIPLAQVAPIVFRTGVRNQGTQTLTGVKSVINVNSGATIAESSAISLAAGAVDTLEVSYTPSALGTYSVAKSLVLTETDDNLTNNVIPNATTFEVTNYIYAVDKGTTYTDYPLTGLTQGGNPVNIDGVGISFDVYANQDIHAIDFRLFTGTTINSEVYGELYKINPNAGALADFWGTPIAETNMFTLTNASQINSIHTIAFTSPYTLEAGETYLVILKIASGTVKIAAAGETETSQSWLSGDHTNKWGTFSDIPVVRANFDPSVGIKNNEFVTGVSLFPNPATEKATVEFNLANASDVAIEVIDITGKVVATKTLTNATSGANAVELNVAGFATGIYSVAIKSNDSSVTRKLIVQ